MSNLAEWLAGTNPSDPESQFVITSDTAIAHLAGALARPVWIPLKQVPDWRFMAGRQDFPWYPTARLFRQTQAGEWDSMFLGMAAELASLIEQNEAE